MRAQFLGSTAVVIRVLCLCGHRSDFYRYFWQRRGYVICDSCKSFILYHSLEIKGSDWEGYLSIDSEIAAGELEAYRLMEEELRAFVERFHLSPEWHWSPRTIQLVKAIEPKLALLEELRRGEGLKQATAA